MRKITVPDEGVETLFGTYDENLKHLESLFNVRIRTQRARAASSKAKPPDVARAERVLDQLVGADARRLQAGQGRREDGVAARRAGRAASSCATTSCKARPARPGKRQVAPKSVNQRRYLDAIEQHDIVFGIGPAGTGKTYLAMAQAVAFLLAKKVSRIILARPAVEAGEKLGFLPGDLQEKVNPYLRPLYDALYDMLDIERAERAARARHDRGRADRVHARPHAERRVRHPRRGAEHDVRADEDVPDAPRLRLEGGHHRRRHADRSADRAHVRPGRGDEGRRQRSRASRSSTSTRRDVVRHKLVQQIVKAYEAYGGSRQ